MSKDMEKDDDLVYNKNDNVKKKNSKESRQELETPENEKEENFEIEGSESEDQMVSSVHVKALQQLIQIVNNHNLGSSQRKQILKILPVFIEHKQIFSNGDLMNSEAATRPSTAHPDSAQSTTNLNQQSEKHKHHIDEKKKASIKSELAEFIGSFDKDFFTKWNQMETSNQSSNSTGHNHKLNKITNNNNPKSELNIEQHEEKIYQLDCALGIEKITSNMGKFEEMNKKFNQLLERQLPGQKKEFLKLFKKSPLSSAFKHNKDFDDDK